MRHPLPASQRDNTTGETPRSTCGGGRGTGGRCGEVVVVKTTSAAGSAAGSAAVEPATEGPFRAELCRTITQQLVYTGPPLSMSHQQKLGRWAGAWGLPRPWLSAKHPTSDVVLSCDRAAFRRHSVRGAHAAEVGVLRGFWSTMTNKPLPIPWMPPLAIFPLHRSLSLRPTAKLGWGTLRSKVPSGSRLCGHFADPRAPQRAAPSQPTGGRRAFAAP